MSAVTTTLPTMAAAEAPAAPAPVNAAPWSNVSRRSIPAVKTVALADLAIVWTAAFATLAGGLAAPATLTDLLSSRVAIGELMTALLYSAIVATVFEVAGLYEAALVRRFSHEFHRVLGAMAAIALLAGVLGAAGEAGMDWAAVLRFWGLGTAALVAVRGIRSRATRSAAGVCRALIVGSGPQALRVCRELSTDPLTSYQVLGFVDTSDAPRSAFIRRRTLGTLDALESILVREHVDEVHVGLPVRSHYPEIQETIRVCERIGVKVMYGADIFGTELARPRVGLAGASPRVELQVVNEGPWTIVKRAIDLAGAAALLVVLSPLLLATALAVKLTSEGPIIFAQERYGLNRRRFKMLKFRSMVVNAEKLQAALESKNEVQGPVFKMKHDPRVTRIGRFIRRTSIDELPQLINVLRGDMSLIGPRPLPLRDVAQFTRSSDMRRFSVRPGLTGLWQVSGRSGLGFDQWIRLDLHYIDNWSLLLDFRILARTIPAVIRGTGAA